jgi:hypothetical protein
VRRLTQLLITLVLAFPAATYITITKNPEVRFWETAMTQRATDLAEIKLNTPKTPTLLFTGGSSCAFSIDPKIIEAICGLNTLNLGLPISTGPRFLLHHALKKATSGDTIIVALEPDLLTYESEMKPTSLTLALALAENDSNGTVGGDTFHEHLRLKDSLNLVRPGANFTFTYIAKIVSGKGYRYTNHDLRYRGRIETSVRDPKIPKAGRKQAVKLSQSGRQLLVEYRQAALKKGVNLVYSMPWTLTDETAADHNRQNNKQILASISEVIAIADDGTQGISTEKKILLGFRIAPNAARLSIAIYSASKCPPKPS